MNVVTMNLPLVIELEDGYFKTMRQIRSLKMDKLRKRGIRNFVSCNEVKI